MFIEVEAMLSLSNRDEKETIIQYVCEGERDSVQFSSIQFSSIQFSSFRLIVNPQSFQCLDQTLQTPKRSLSQRYTSQSVLRSIVRHRWRERYRQGEREEGRGKWTDRGERAYLLSDKRRETLHSVELPMSDHLCSSEEESNTHSW